jgi:DNA-binding CsgD family transcriptional regulator
MVDTPDLSDGSGSTVAALVDRALDAGVTPDRLSDDIIGSWRRSAGAGLSPEMFVVPFDADVDDGGRLAWAAQPVLDRMGDDLIETGVGLVLTDARGVVVSRRAADRPTRGMFDNIQLAPGFQYGEEHIGTNAIGTALQLKGPTLVLAEQHFADALTRMACAATTVTDPSTGRVLGVVDLSCAADAANPLMLPLAKRAVWEIEQRLLEESATSEPVLREQFLKARRGTRAPLVAVSQRAMLVNAAASSLLEQTDHERLWECVVGVLQGKTDICSFPLGNGQLATFRCQPVLDGARFVGALLLAEAAAGSGRLIARQRREPPTAGFGWESLTDAELAVAAHVSRGMTNREVAARLYLSPHTIDFHLRQLFRKLDVTSRVELTRVVLESASATAEPRLIVAPE